MGVASEALVEFIRNEMPHSTTAQNFKIEGLALLIRESTVAYAYARGGIHAAVAAQTIVSGTTLFEAIQGGAELAWATYTQPQRDRRQSIGAEFLKLRATFKAETSAERKAQALALLDAFLAGPGRLLFEAFPDPAAQRKIYVCTLAKASNIEWQCA